MAPPSVDYDRVAAEYDRRYEENQYPGIDRLLQEFVRPSHTVLEVGCGTGYWLARFLAYGCQAVGLDLSSGMLRRALTYAGRALLVQGRAEVLPFRAGTFDRIIVVNALHHFEEPEAFVQGAFRLLGPGGRVVVLGLDPGRGMDEWFIYDYFPPTLQLDRERYPATGRIAEWFTRAGFVDCSSRVAHHIAFERSARDYLDRGLLTRDSTSQLSLLADEDYAAGMARIRAAARMAEAQGQDLKPHADLRIYATFGTAVS